jgi:deoxyuridine 5'-triphosphate nucleotidohydrolase
VFYVCITDEGDGRCFVLRYEKLTQNALPPRETSKSAGIDLKSSHNFVISAWGNAIIKTDLVIQLPPACYGRIAPRSSLALHHSITVGGGVVNEDYRGNVCNPTSTIRRHHFIFIGAIMLHNLYVRRFVIQIWKNSRF